MTSSRLLFLIGFLLFVKCSPQKNDEDTKLEIKELRTEATKLLYSNPNKV